MGLTINDRKVMAKRWADGERAVSIAKGLGRSPGTIYAELTREHTGELDLNFRPKGDASGADREAHPLRIHAPHDG